MTSLVRSAVVTWVIVWSTARQDVALHLIAWIVIGGFLAGSTREIWIESFPYVVDFAEDLSNELLEILPDSPSLIKLFSITICGMSQFFLAGAEAKNSKEGMRGTWIFFALSHILFPISFCGIDLLTSPPSSSSSVVNIPNDSQQQIDLFLFVLFFILSLFGPISSWPSRSFAIADMTYGLMVGYSNQICSGTEAAVVACLLVLGHDAIHTRFLHFIESIALAIAAVFILETSIIVLYLDDILTKENWNDSLNLLGVGSLSSYLVTKAPPVILTSWAVGTFLRTFTQGKISKKELAIAVSISTAIGLVILLKSNNRLALAQTPSFASVIAVIQMLVGKKFALGRKRVLKKNEYIFASGVFPAYDEVKEVNESEEEEKEISQPQENKEQQQQQLQETDLSRELENQNLMEQFNNSNNTLIKTSVGEPVKSGETLQVEINQEHQKQKGLDKRLFLAEAKWKGTFDPLEKQKIKDEIASLKEKKQFSMEIVKQKRFKLKTMLVKNHTKTQIISVEKIIK